MTGHLGTDFVMRPWDTTAVKEETVTMFCAVNGTDSNRNLPTVTWLKGGSTIDTRFVLLVLVGFKWPLQAWHRTIIDLSYCLNIIQISILAKVGCNRSQYWDLKPSCI